METVNLILSGTGRFQVSVDFIIMAGKRYERERNGRRCYSHEAHTGVRAKERVLTVR